MSPPVRLDPFEEWFIRCQARQLAGKAGLTTSDVEDTLLLALLAADGVFSEARVRLDSAIRIDQEARTVRRPGGPAFAEVQVVSGPRAAQHVGTR